MFMEATGGRGKTKHLQLAERPHGSSTASAMLSGQARVVANPDGDNLRTFHFFGGGCGDQLLERKPVSKLLAS